VLARMSLNDSRCSRKGVSAWDPSVGTGTTNSGFPDMLGLQVFGERETALPSRSVLLRCHTSLPIRTAFAANRPSIGEDGGSKIEDRTYWRSILYPPSSMLRVRGGRVATASGRSTFPLDFSYILGGDGGQVVRDFAPDLLRDLTLELLLAVRDPIPIYHVPLGHTWGEDVETST
jgi:hypothetical protein